MLEQYLGSRLRRDAERRENKERDMGMVGKTSMWRNPSYLESSTGIFFFFCAWGVWWSFYQRWLVTGLGMTNTQVGNIYSINSVATLIIMFVYGVIQDELGVKRRLAVFIAAIAALVGPFVQFVYAPLMRSNLVLGAVLGAVVLSAGFMSGCSLIEAITERYSRKFGFEYGTVFDQQMFPNYYANLFPTPEQGNEVYGILNSFQVFLESAMMGVVPVIMRKIGVRNSLLLGATVMFARIGLCGFFHDPIAVSVVKLFHSIEVPLFCLPAFRYFTLHFNPKLSATLYMVGFQIASQVGQVVLSTPLGMLHDRAGDRTTFYTISIVVLVALIYGFFVLKKDDQQVDGDPFIRDSQKVKVVEA